MLQAARAVQRKRPGESAEEEKTDNERRTMVAGSSRVQDAAGRQYAGLG